MKGVDNVHPSRWPRWTESCYTGAERVAKGAHPPADVCPCGKVDHIEGEEHAECIECETFRCPRCERWCSWEMGCADDMPALCDDCATAI